MIQSMCRHPLGGDAELGEPARFPTGIDDASTAESVLRALAAYTGARWDPARGRKHDAKFRREHQLVDVTSYADGRIELIPMHREQGGYHGTRDLVLETTLSAGVDPLRDQLREAFRRVI